MNLQELVDKGKSVDWARTFKEAKGLRVSRDEWRSIYHYYLQSECWRAKSAFITKTRIKCERCRVRPATQTHHLTYDRCGAELEADLQAICRPCHESAHPNRRSDIVPVAKRSRFEMGREAYRRKVLERKVMHGHIDGAAYQKGLEAQEPVTAMAKWLADAMPRADMRNYNVPDDELIMRVAHP